MKAYFYTVIFLVCSFAGLIHNAMERDPLLNKKNEQPAEANIMIRNLFNATYISKRDIAKKKLQKDILKEIRLIFNDSFLTIKTLDSVTSKHSKRTLLQEMVYLLLPEPVKLLLLRGVNPKTKGVSEVSPFDMLNTYKISSLFKRKKFSGKSRSLKLPYSVRFAECYNLIVKGEECWNHREQCKLCGIHVSNNTKKQNNNKNCKHRKGCFLCRDRLKKVKKVEKSKKSRKK